VRSQAPGKEILYEAGAKDNISSMIEEVFILDKKQKANTILLFLFFFIIFVNHYHICMPL
jgi:hypothetical protein